MNKKATNWLFLVFLAVEAAVIALLRITEFQISIVGSLVLNQLIFLVPAVCFLIKTKTAFSDVAPHKRIHPATPFLCIVFTGLCMPLVTVCKQCGQSDRNSFSRDAGMADHSGGRHFRTDERGVYIPRRFLSELPENGKDSGGNDNVGISVWFDASEF